MPGLYMHIPFCESRCIYCDFYSTTDKNRQAEYIGALHLEYRQRRNEILADGRQWDTIYIGGGTPSTLPPDMLRMLLAIPADDIGESTKEITLECNPDDITPEYAAALNELPVNRVSMGAQTFDDNRLRFIRRRHSSSQIAEAVGNLRQAGFSNISIDLMYGFPDETVDDFRHDIEKALALDVPHISAYCLMYEEDTALYRMLEQGKITEIDEETERRMYEMLICMLQDAGYEHYEISNFARPGYRSRHNSSYWNLTPYLGIGAAAHSFDGKAMRSSNPLHLIKYIKAISDGRMPMEREHLSAEECYNDYIMLRLRTAEGIDLNVIERLFGLSLRKQTEQMAIPFIAGGLLAYQSGNILHLTKKGMFVSNMVMSEFMIV